MKFCRFSEDRLGLIDGDRVIDISDALAELPDLRWPLRPGDELIWHLDAIEKKAASLMPGALAYDLASVALKSPVANPSKIIGAPANYDDHLAEAMSDQGIAHGRSKPKLGEWGLFLKANSSLIGPGEDIKIKFLDRRNDHELELAVVIGKIAKDIPAASAIDCVAGYAIGLDMTVRGSEVQSFRKSLDTFSVIGPCLVTRDEVPEPNSLDMHLSVNGQIRQSSNTRLLRMNVEELIAFASSFYTLYPGDIIMTGTPAGVGPIQPGDTIVADIQNIGEMTVAIT